MHLVFQLCMGYGLWVVVIYTQPFLLALRQEGRQNVARGGERGGTRLFSQA